jgi:lipopolysaccharide export system permease protein
MGKGLSLATYGELFFYFGINMTPMAFPLATLMAALISFGTLGEHRELTAIKGAGISLLRIIQPAFFLTIFLSFASYYINDYVIPETNLRAYSLLWDVRQKKPTLNLKEGAFYNGIPGYSIKVGKKMEDEESLQKVIIYDHQDGRGNNRVTLADSGRMYTLYGDRYLVMELYNGKNYSENIPSNRFVSNKPEFIRSHFSESRIVFNLSSFNFSRTDMSLFSSNRIMKNASILKADADSMRKEQGKVVQDMQHNFIYYYSFKYKKDTAQIDIVAKKKFIDSLYALPEKQKIINTAALNQARNVRTYIKSTQERLKYLKNDANSYDVERYKKYMQPLSCLVLFLIGAPLGAIIKKGGLGMPVVISICFIVIYYILTNSTEKWAKQDVMPVLFAMWLPNATLLVIGAFFLQQARNDSNILELDHYRLMWSKWRNKK